MKKKILQEFLIKPQSRFEIITEFCNNKDVLDIGCVQHDINNADSAGWLHGHIVNKASFTLGVDYLQDAVDSLAKRGFNVLVGDVNKPLEIHRQFDVIVVGNLIEHLSNFEGLISNIIRLLRPNGVVLISTANPFYREQYFYSAYKNDILINPEHTCWIDPVALDQLAMRFGLYTVEVRWIKEKWNLAGGPICINENNILDIFTGKWHIKKDLTLYQKLLLKLIRYMAPLIFKTKNLDRFLDNKNEESDKVSWLFVKSSLFGFYWKIRRYLIPSSPINNFELFFSILKKDLQ